MTTHRSYFGCIDLRLVISSVSPFVYDCLIFVTADLVAQLVTVLKARYDTQMYHRPVLESPSRAQFPFVSQNPALSVNHASCGPLFPITLHKVMGPDTA